MKKSVRAAFFVLVWLPAVWCPAETPPSTAISTPALLEQIKSTYAGGDFTARFEQESTLKAMNITDTASGKAYFMEPGMMRWEYVEPDPQQIITDGKKLWIYKPLENQVMVGEAPALFGEDKGISFLAAVKDIEEKNKVSVDLERKKPGYYTLKLEPRKKTNDMAVVYLYVSQKSGLIEEIETINTYDDTTRIIFSDIILDAPLDTSLFVFDVPTDADVLLLDTQK